MSEGLQGKHWCGDYAATLDYYQRHVTSALGDCLLRQSSYNRHFDPVLLQQLIDALAKMVEHLEQKQ